MTSSRSNKLSLRVLTETSGRPHSVIQSQICQLLDSAGLDVEEPSISVTQNVQAPYEEPVTSVQASVTHEELPLSESLRMSAEKAARSWCSVTAYGLNEQVMCGAV